MQTDRANPGLRQGASSALRNDAIYDPAKPFNDQIRKQIEATHPKTGPLVVEPQGKRFKMIRDWDYWKGHEELTGTDGIGTKGLLHWKMGTLHYGAQDAFAMVVDDLIEGGYVPVHFQDHILMQEENQERIFQITKALVVLSIKNPWKTDEVERPMIMTGGETAIINTLQGFELGITGTGYVVKGGEITRNAVPGDLLIGLESNGIHSNGLSFFRKEFFENRGYSLDHVLPWGMTVGQELTKPTNVYLPAIKELIGVLGPSQRKGEGAGFIHGMVHITGGGLSKLRELIGDEKEVEIKTLRDHRLGTQDIFSYVQSEFHIPPVEMYKKFNNGVGYVIAVDNRVGDVALRILNKYFRAAVIGGVVKGDNRVSIESQYNSELVSY